MSCPLKSKGVRRRSEQAVESDLNVLVSFTETAILLKFIELENHLTDLPGTKVDLVMRYSLFRRSVNP
jgi:predicted nucleotidyltransferase